MQHALKAFVYPADSVGPACADVSPGRQSRMPGVAVISGNGNDENTITEQLERAGYEVACFESLRELTGEHLTAELFCVVILTDRFDASYLRVPAALKQLESAASVVLLVRDAQFIECTKAIRAGIFSYLPAATEMRNLIPIVRDAETESKLTAARIARHRLVKGNHSSLTKREAEVFQLLVKGLSNRAVGESLNAAEATIKIHRRRLMVKMGATSMFDLFSVAQILMNAGC